MQFARVDFEIILTASESIVHSLEKRIAEFFSCWHIGSSFQHPRHVAIFLRSLGHASLRLTFSERRSCYGLQFLAPEIPNLFLRRMAIVASAIHLDVLELPKQFTEIPVVSFVLSL